MTAPRVEACIDAVMAKYPRTDPVSQAKYYEEVHQHLGLLARDLEHELAKMTAENEALRHDINRHIENHAADLNADNKGPLAMSREWFYFLKSLSRFGKDQQ